MPIRLVYPTANISALSRSLDSTEIYISYSVHKSEWHSIIKMKIKNKIKIRQGQILNLFRMNQYIII